MALYPESFRIVMLNAVFKFVSQPGFHWQFLQELLRRPQRPKFLPRGLTGGAHRILAWWPEARRDALCGLLGRLGSLRGRLGSLDLRGTQNGT